MGKHIDLTGQTFERLTVIKRAENNKDGRICYLCECKCGNEVTVIGRRLTSELTKSCGCYIREITSKRVKKGYGEAAFTALLNHYKHNAKKERHEFSLTEDEFRDLVLCNCCYCGRPPYNESKNSYNNGNFKYTGIDRIDNTKGYVKGNVRPCCKQCNYIKSNYGTEDFLSHVKTIYEHLSL